MYKDMLNTIYDNFEIRNEMLILTEVMNSTQCEVDIDYYVPFTIKLGNRTSYTSKIYWRIGNFKNSLMEISIDDKSGMLRDVTLISVDKAYLVNTTLQNIEPVENGMPVFLLDGNIQNGLYDYVMDFYVYLNIEFIMVNFSEECHPYKFVELGRVRFGFDKDNRLISVIVKDLSGDEYSELKDGLKL